MAVEHAMFKFGDLKVTSRDDRMTDRMTTKVLSSRRPRSSAARPIIETSERQRERETETCRNRERKKKKKKGPEA